MIILGINAYHGDVSAALLRDGDLVSAVEARDGLGVKPLYYAQTPQGFLFASEIKALLQRSPWCPGTSIPSP